MVKMTSRYFSHQALVITNHPFFYDYSDYICSKSSDVASTSIMAETGFANHKEHRGGNMKGKHLAIRIEQCLALSKASNCPRRKFGALLVDPERNVVLMDGYNGGPRG